MRDRSFLFLVLLDFIYWFTQWDRWIIIEHPAATNLELFIFSSQLPLWIFSSPSFSVTSLIEKTSTLSADSLTILLWIHSRQLLKISFATPKICNMYLLSFISLKVFQNAFRISFPLNWYYKSFRMICLTFKNLTFKISIYY